MKRKNEILKYLPDEDKLLFLSALLDAITLSKKKNSFAPIDECLSSWEETAELYSIPGLSESAWKRFEKLKSRGLIHG
jgi:diketogulonate reductase-like aldo/keto reductase